MNWYKHVVVWNKSYLHIFIYKSIYLGFTIIIITTKNNDVNFINKGLIFLGTLLGKSNNLQKVRNNFFFFVNINQII